MPVFSEPRLLNAQRWRNMRVGILGGSFNPPHEGHVHISKMALKAFELDAIWWLVTPLNPLKSRDNLLSVEKRVELSRDINTHPKIIVTGMEDGFETTHSYASVKILKRYFPNTQFAWITGMDNAHNFHLWNHWKLFLNEMCMIHVTRHPPVRLMKQCPLRMLSSQKHIIVDHGGKVPLDSNTSYWLLQKKMINISSTEIRSKSNYKTVS
ncbi:MAG: adenylyltransferase/cytidyltransferase family protein [Alcanivorax sp.]